MPAESSEVIVNTGPLIALAICGQLGLMHSLHLRVIVPESVVAQLERGQQVHGGVTIDLREWIEVLTPPARRKKAAGRRPAFANQAVVRIMELGQSIF